MKKIKLGGKRGGYALVDNADYLALQQFKWCKTNTSSDHLYVVRGGRTGETSIVYLHRQLMDFPKRPLEVDHINGNRLDNRRANLRIVTHRDNCTNQNCSIKSKHGRNVYYDPTKTNAYYVQCSRNRRRYCGGRFYTAEEAQERAAALRKELGYLTRTRK